jgi:hypothetical protein
VLCPRWHALFSVRRTLVSGATDADISVCRLTLVRALLKEATDAVVLKRWARLMQLHAVWELTGLRPSSDGRATCVPMDVSVALGQTQTLLDCVCWYDGCWGCSRRTRLLIGFSTVGTSIAQDTW